MNMPGFSRSTFLLAAAATAALSRMRSADAAEQQSSPPPLPRRKVLVLSGGTAHGAYEAGVLEGLRTSQYDLICGTSIGALNGAMFAARGVDQLASLWHGLGAAVVLELKAPYRDIVEPSAGLGTRAYEAYHLAKEATGGTLQGVMRSQPVIAILREHLVTDGRVAPFHMPLFWATSNLTAGCAGYYYRNPPQSAVPEFDAAKATVARFAAAAANSSVGAREVPEDTEQILEALRASSAIPAVFDPSFVPNGPNVPYAGNTLVDGGVVNNTPFALVRAAAAEGPLDVDAVLLGTPSAAHMFADTKNILGILLACYDLMTQKLMDDAVRALSREVASANALRSARAQMQRMVADLGTADVVSSPLARNARLDAVKAAAAQIDDVLGSSVGNDVTIRFRSPSAPLVGSSFAFTDQGAIEANYGLGLADIDGGKGWLPFSIPADLCKLGGDVHAARLR
jgi:predicted acylesterase/phospholipase RssA